MNIENAVQYDKHSLWGRIFFAHYSRVEEYPPKRTDSCHVRKVAFFLAPWSWFFKGRLGNIIKPWHIFVIAAYILAAYLYTNVTAAFTAGVLATMLIAMVAAALLLLGIVLDEATSAWRETHLIIPVRIFKRSLRDSLMKTSFYKALDKFGNRGITISSLHLSIVLILIIVGAEIYAHFAHIKWLFDTILYLVIGIVALIVVLFGLWASYHLYQDSSLKEKMDNTIARSVTKPVKNTWQIAYDWFKDFKNRVCRPVVWVDTNS